MCLSERSSFHYTASAKHVDTIAVFTASVTHQPERRGKLQYEASFPEDDEVTCHLLLSPLLVPRDGVQGTRNAEQEGGSYDIS